MDGGAAGEDDGGGECGAKRGEGFGGEEGVGEAGGGEEGEGTAGGGGLGGGEGGGGV